MQEKLNCEQTALRLLPVVFGIAPEARFTSAKPLMEFDQEFDQWTSVPGRDL
jgi:hypothetical protein